MEKGEVLDLKACMWGGVLGLEGEVLYLEYRSSRARFEGLGYKSDSVSESGLSGSYSPL